MDRQYFVESIIDASDGDESYSYAIVCVEQGQARTVCMGVQSRAEAQKIANGLTWYETFLEGRSQCHRQRYLLNPRDARGLKTRLSSW